ncbi:MAG: type I restriction enzyme HsdR N-terminal domain-containing protein [Bergeyella sp.]|nr:type I restriction enzyme HsdR N-terminal domain-containing protein [Bergeyella sp.]
MRLAKLNFPHTYPFRLRKDKDKFFIHDVLRKMWLVLTPEEWVRQHWIHYFLKDKGYYPSALIAEKKIQVNGLVKRLDLLVTEKAKPVILVECKGPKIPITENTFEQTARYNSSIQAKNIILSNGVQHIFSTFDGKEYSFEILQL